MANLLGSRVPLMLKISNNYVSCLLVSQVKCPSSQLTLKSIKTFNKTYCTRSGRQLPVNHCIKGYISCTNINLLHTSAKIKPLFGVKSSFIFGPCVSSVRFKSNSSNKRDEDQLSTVLYVLSMIIASLGFAYAFVPLFKAFCRQFGLGGQSELSRVENVEKVIQLHTVEDREIKVNFSSSLAALMQWDFKPQQQFITVKPGETALAFYTANNPTDAPIVGISTYSITPYNAAPYFNKIQCFCFEEQILNPGEQVDMPVFFFIDPEMDEDPNLESVDEITLNYTFFKAKKDLNLHLPGFTKSTYPAAKI